MEILKTLLLGVIQGLTEFLPVSSSGHLIIAQTFMGGGSEPETGSAMLLEVVLHVATGIAVLFVFRKDIIGIIRGCFSRDAVERKGSLTYSGLVILATIPAALAGILLNDRIDALFDTSKGNTAAYVASFMLFVTAGLLVLSSRKILLQNLCKLVLSALIGLLRHLCKLALSALTGLLRRFTRNDRYCE
jgi:undecaprenyl-diphosphatase